MRFKSKNRIVRDPFKKAQKVVSSQNEQYYHVKPCNRQVCQSKTKSRILFRGMGRR